MYRVFILRFQSGIVDFDFHFFHNFIWQTLPGLPAGAVPGRGGAKIKGPQSVFPPQFVRLALPPLLPLLP